MSKREKVTPHGAAITESGELEFGIVVSGERHCAFVVRAASLSDVYRAAETVPLPDNLQTDAAARLAYQIAVDDAQILCQVVALGTLDPVPSVAELIAQIDPEDMALLRDAAVAVKKKLRLSRFNLPTCVPSKSPSSSSASA